jgi:uncharacterized repeat protein (TIGR03806 family)
MRCVRLAVVVVFAVSLLAASAFAVESPAKKKAFDIEHRQLWTTDNIHGSPEPPDPYTTEVAFPKIKLFEPLSVDWIPNAFLNGFAVATRPGKIVYFPIKPDVDRVTEIIDLKRTVYGVAFHPEFTTNGQFFVTSIIEFDKPNGSRISRFTVKDLKARQYEADLESEEVIFEWPSGGHNGGCLRFGPDGYLYIATGDGSGIADGLQTGQDLSDALGAILRIDVDHRDPGKNYAIPKDNPFVNVPGARGEIWSFGHRQVWKFSFDNNTKRLWGGEVGQDLWEMVYLIERGGNYGWSVMEGAHPFRPERTKGPGEFVKPIVEHPHSDFRSITGGYVYQSDRLPELKGTYIYGDYDTGKLWSLKYDQSTSKRGKNSDLKKGVVSNHRELADTQIRIVEFAQDLRGDVYLLDFAGGQFHTIVKSPPVVATKPFPQKLSQTGLFASTKEHVPATGLIPYSVNAALWSDGAEKERFLALPGDSKIGFDKVVYPHGPDYPDLGWRFPDGTVLVKTFSMEMEKGNPASAKRLETRILQYRKMPGNDDEYGAQYWSGYTYVWNEEQTDAELLAAGGLDRTLTIKDAAAADGKRDITWHFPSRAECALCHTMAAKYALGVTTLQMNKDHDYGGKIANQLAVLEKLGVFQEKLPMPPAELPSLADYHNEKEDLQLRARSYLHANCAHCHRKWGGGNAEFELHASFPLTLTAAVDAKPGQGTFKLTDPKIIAPGDPHRSMILERMKLEGLGRMPHIASKVVDKEGVELIEKWLGSLKSAQELEKPGAKHPRLPTMPPSP